MIKRFIAAALVAVFTVAGANAQLLYKISGKDLTAPSYIIGTHHLANVGFVNKIAGVKDALTSTEQVYGEVRWDDMTNPDSLKVMQAAMMLPDGQSLKTVLSAEQYKKLDAVITQMMGVGLSNPQVGAQMGKMSPAALSTQLQVLMFMQKHMGEYDPSSTFDQYFQAQAKTWASMTLRAHSTSISRLRQSTTTSLWAVLRPWPSRQICSIRAQT